MSDISLRTALFQRYAQLQMWLISRVIWYTAVLYLVTLVLFALLRMFTGLSIKRIGYFNLRHIVLTPQQGIEVRIGKLGIAPHRPTVARPGFLTFLVSNLEIVIDPNVTIEQDMKKAATEKSSDSADSNKVDEELFGESLDSDADSFILKGIPLVPRRSKFLFNLVRWAVTQMKVFDIQFHSVSLVFTDVMTLIVTSINTRLDLRKTRNYNVSNFVGTLDTYKLNDGELPINAKLSVTDVYTAESLEDESPWQVFEDLRFDVSGVLNLDHMCAKELGIHIQCGRLQLDVAHIIDMLQKVKDIRVAKGEASTAQNSSTNSDSIEPSPKPKIFSAQDKKRLVKAAMLLLHLVHRVQLNVVMTEILRVPVDTALFASRMKDLNLDLSRMNPQSSGFKLFYGEGDIAHQSIFTVASVTAGIDTGSIQEEVLYIPLVTSLTRGNLFSQTLRFVQEDKKKNDSMLKTSWVLHAPNVSIEEHQISTLVRVFLGLEAHGKNAPNKSGTNSPVDDFGYILKLPLQNILPKVDWDLTVNDPAFRMVCENTENCKESMFVLSSARLHMALKSTHKSETDSYSGVAVFETFGDRGYYHSATANTVDMIASESTKLTVRANTHPQFNVEVEGKQNGFRVTALRHEIFCAIGQAHACVRKALRQWNKEHSTTTTSPPPGRRVSINDDEILHKGSTLRAIPFWLKRFSFKANNSSISIATNQFRGQTNETLGLKLSSSSLAIGYQSKLTSAELSDDDEFLVESPTDGRRLVVSASDLNLFKADRLLLAQPDEAGVSGQHSVAQLPKLGLLVRTHNGERGTVEVNIEPRLRIDLNVNLILAFSVVREIVDKALLRHDKEFEDEFAAEDGEMELSDLDQEKLRVKEKANREHHNIIVTMPRALIKVDMPSDDQVMLEFGATTFKKLALKNPEIHSNAIKLYSQHPFKRVSWCILASLNHVNAEYVLDAKPHVDDKVKLNLGGMRINVPYQFKLYRIIDNGITLAKAIKTLILQTKSIDWMIVLNPTRIENIPNIPRIRLVTPQLQLSLEDDYFESDLTLIMLAQRDVSSKSRRKLYMFESRIKALMREGLKTLEEEESDKRALQQQNQKQQKRPKQPSHNSTVSANNLSEYRKAHDHVSNVASNVRKTATTVIDHLHESRSQSRTPENYRESPHVFNQTLASSLRHVSKQKIEILLGLGVELGCPADDHDPVLTNHHPWLDFWSSSDFKEFRNLHLRLDDGSLGKLTINEARSALLEDFSRIWIDSIRQERNIQHLGAKMKRDEVFEDEFDHNTCIEESIVDYTQKPLLMSVDFRQLDLTIDQTSYNGPEKLRKFLHEIGKGQPMDSEFSILVPLFIDLKAQGGLKVDIKDYPLPVLHFPGLSRTQDPKSNMALQIKGDMIITEQLMTSEHNIRNIYVPLRPLPRELRRTKGSDVIEVHRTLTPIKTFTNLSFHVGSTLPTRVCWCMAYKPGFHSVGEAFSGFSKPPVDPSPALGFWDKIRLVLHARLDFKLPKSPLCLCLKAGKSPYELLNDSSGFLFCWSDDVHVQINPDDDPKNLFAFSSNMFELSVPNYISWEREFLQATPGERALPRSPISDKVPTPEKVVFSFAQPTSWTLGMMFEKTSGNVSDKDGNTLDQRDADFRDHYDVELCTPEYIDDVQRYDAYEGFRSDFIHMAISVVSRPGKGTENQFSAESQWASDSDSSTTKGANKCAAHLSLGVIRHFKYWKDQFDGEQWPPIKLGSLFPDPVRVRPSKKTFSTALSTAQYQIALSPLDLSFFHQMRHHVAAENHDRCTGLKAKIEDFVFDWHTRREPPTSTNENGDEVPELTSHRRWRMKSNRGEVRVDSMQMRVVDAKLKTQSSKAALRALQDDDNSDSEMEDDISDTTSTDEYSSSNYESRNTPSGTGTGSNMGSQSYGPKYVGHDYWVDLDDYSEVGKHRNLRSRTPDVKVLPFIYTPQFCYVRSTDFSGQAVYVDRQSKRKMPKFGDILVHDCMISEEQPEKYQASLLTGRREQVNERISDLRASLESLESQSQRTKEIEKKIQDLKKYIAIGESNAVALEKEISYLSDIASEADKKTADLKSKIETDFNEQMRSNKASSSNEKASDDDASSIESQAQEDLDGPASYHPETGALDNDLSLYRNRYIIHAMHLRWNNSVRNLIYRLQVSLSEDKELDYVRCRRSVQYLEELVAKAEEMAEESGFNGSHKTEKSQSTEDKSTNDEKSRFTRKTGNRHNYADEDIDPHDTRERERRNERDMFHDAPETVGNSDRRESVISDDGYHMRLRTLFEDLQEVKESEIAQKSHSVSFLTPRIQMIAEVNPSKCLQVLARDIGVQVVDVYSKQNTGDSDSAQIERRYGALLNKSEFFVLSEEDVQQTGVEALCLECYSGEEEHNNVSWPPWLAMELCYDPSSLKQFILMEDVSFGVRMNQPNDLHVASDDQDDDSEDNSDGIDEAQAADTAKTSASAQEDQETSGEEPKDGEGNEDPILGISQKFSKTLKHHGHHDGKALMSSLVVDAPRLVVNVDSVQFYTFYTILVDLVTYRDPLIKKREQAIDRVFLSNDFQGDYRATLKKIELLQKDILSIITLYERLMIVCMNPQDTHRETKIHLIKLQRECMRRMTRLTVLMRAFKAGLRKNMNTGTERLFKCSLLADSILLRILSEVGTPILELYVRRVHYSRLSSDHAETSLNRATLGGVYARNLMPNSTYPMVLANYELDEYTESEEAAKVKWTRLDRVGGIPVLGNAEIKLKPLHVQLEHGVFEKILDFAFPINRRSEAKEDSNNKKHRINGNDEEDNDENSESPVLYDESDTESDSDISLTLSEIDRYGKKSPRYKSKSKQVGLFRRLRKGKSKRKSRSNDVDEMMDRASNYWSIRSLKIHPTQLTISYKGKTRYSILNLQNLQIPMPLFSITNKTCTKLDLIMRIKKMAIKTLLAQSGSIIGNKFKRHKQHATEDDRDLNLDMLLRKTSRRSSRASVKSTGTYSEVGPMSWHSSDKDSGRSSEDDSLALVPVHRQRAQDDPENAKHLAWESIAGADSNTTYNNTFNATQERNSFHSQRKQPSQPSGQRTYQSSQRTLLSNHRRTASSESAREQPGSPWSLRQPQSRPQKQSGSDSPKSSRSSFTGSSSTLLDKIRKGFN